MVTVKTYFCAIHFTTQNTIVILFHYGRRLSAGLDWGFNHCTGLDWGFKFNHHSGLDWGFTLYHSTGLHWGFTINHWLDWSLGHLDALKRKRRWHTLLDISHKVSWNKLCMNA